VPNRYTVPFDRRNVSGSNSSPSAGESASSTRGSASAENAMETIAHTESRCLGSAVTIDSSAWSHDSAARGSAVRIATASRACTADRDHR